MRFFSFSLLILSMATSVLFRSAAAQEGARVGLVLPQVIGEMPVNKALAELTLAGEAELVQEIRSSAVNSQNLRFADLQLGAPPIYRYTSHAFGFIPPAQARGTSPVAITDVGNTQPDLGLRGASVKVTLDRVRVYDYPGKGERHILVNFQAQHQATGGQKENIQFTQTYRVNEGGGAGITGYPVFVGLQVPSEGVAFQIYTVNVENTNDRNLLNFMDSPIFKNGLELLNSANPLVPVVTGFATGITRSLAARNNNVPVQDIYMGLDFSSAQTRAKLKEGSYIVVQVPDGPWDWSQWVYNPATGQVVSRTNASQMIPLNYIVFSVSKVQA
jgi:hypothetical protein